MPTSTTEAKPPRPHRGGLQRVTVNLTPRSCQALEMAIKRTGDSQTDAINRAIRDGVFELSESRTWPVKRVSWLTRLGYRLDQWFDRRAPLPSLARA